MKENSSQIGFLGVCESIQGPLPKIPKIISSISPFSFFVSTVQKSRCNMPKCRDNIYSKKGETFGK